jgi:hypothetical protein
LGNGDKELINLERKEKKRKEKKRKSSAPFFSFRFLPFKAK